jgi:ribosome biogenesis GTPase A
MRRNVVLQIAVMILFSIKLNRCFLSTIPISNVVNRSRLQKGASTRLFGKKKLDEFELARRDPSLSKMDLNDVGNDGEDFEEMSKRLDFSKNFAKISLSDEDSKEFNRILGIKVPAGSFKTELKSDKKHIKKSTKNEKPVDSKTVLKVDSKKKEKYQITNDAGSEDVIDMKKLRGFLDMNPYICSGCGTQFQCKKTDSPGFLPADKFQFYRKKAEIIQKQQEAIRLLSLASISIDSPFAEETLRRANVDEAVIRGVKRQALKMQIANGETDDKKTKKRSEENVSPVELNPELENYLKRKVKAKAHLLAKDPEELLNRPFIRPDYSHQKNKKQKASDELSQETITNNEDTGSARAMVNGSAVSETSELDDEYEEVDELEENYPNSEEDSEEFQKIQEAKSEARANTDDDEDDIPQCRRCFRLQQYGTIEDELRPGWSENELLTPERFESLLSNIKNTKSVILCLVDIFDLSGSLVKNLKEIVGDNPLYIGVNKIDLLPTDISKKRVLHWVHTEIKRICGFESPKREPQQGNNGREDRFSRNYDGNSPHSFQRNMDFQKNEKGILKENHVFLVSCNSGVGIPELMKELLTSSEVNGKKIHVMGAANVGKSSFINRIMNPALSPLKDKHKSSKRQNKEPTLTVSNLPGTTLNFLKIKLSNNNYLIDTPGLINRGHLTSKLTTEELKDVIPSKPIKPVTFRLEENKSVLMGGMARMDVVQVRNYFYFFHFLIIIFVYYF